MAVFTNRATLSYNGITTASNTVTGEIVGALAAEKTALDESYSSGGSITYVISLINSGQTELTGLTVTDDLGEAGSGNAPLDLREGSCAMFINGLAAPAPAVSTAAGLEFSGISLPAEANALIVYTADVNAYAPLALGSTIVNTASAEADGMPVTASASVQVCEEAQLAIEKSVSPLSVTENGTLTYTFVITNTGNTAAGPEALISVSDTFSPALSGITVTLDGSPMTSPGGFTYDEATGMFATAPGAITVPAATYTPLQDKSFSVEPGTATLTVSGTV